jgi:hypothetical protein
MALILGRTSKVGKLDVIERRVGTRMVSDPSTSASASSSSATPTLLWSDEFNLAANTAPDPLSWTTIHSGSTDYSGAPIKAANAFHKGDGTLVCRCQRELTAWHGDNNEFPSSTALFSGMFIATASHDAWPMTTVKRAFTPPFRMEARMKYPPMPGGWGGLWSESANKNNTTQGVMEMDWSEVQFNAASMGNKDARAFQHWTGNDASGVKHSDPLTNPTVSWPYLSSTVAIEQRDVWVIKSVDVWVDGSTPYQPRYYVEVDGSGNRQFEGAGPALRDAPNATGGFQTNVTMDFQIDWRLMPAPGGGYTLGTNKPLDSDNGPWDLLIDYVRVYDLTGVTAP